MATTADILKRLEATAKLLKSVSSHGCYAQISSSQAEKIRQMIDSSEVTDEGSTADIIAGISGAPWASQGELEGLVLAAGSKVRLEVRAPAHNATQKWRIDHLNFYTQHIWDSLADKELDAEGKLYLIGDHLIKLGLRWPCEKTSRCVMQLWLYCCHGFVQARALDVQQVQHAYVHVKTTLKRRAVDGDPARRIWTLGAAEEFAVTHPAVWAAVFKDNLPVKCPIAVADLGSIACKVNLRPRKGAIYGASSAQSEGSHMVQPYQPVHPFQPSAFPPQAMQCMAQMMMTSMQQMMGGRFDGSGLQIFSGANAARGETPLAKRQNSTEVAGSGRQRELPLAGEEGAAEVANESEQDSDGDEEGSPSKARAPKMPKGASKVPKPSVDDVADHLLAKMREPKTKKPKAEPKAKPKETTTPMKGKKKVKKSHAAKADGDRPPSLCCEHSRSHYLFRTGKRGRGQSLTFKFSDHGGKCGAQKKAQAWFDKELKKFHSK